MRINIRDRKSHATFCKWVLVCCALHNMLEEKLGSGIGEDVDEDEEDSNAGLFFGATPESKRQAIANSIINN